MRYVYSISGFSGFTASEVNTILPPHISIRKEDGQFLLFIESSSAVNDDQAFLQAQQELDRIFFLTGRTLTPEFIRKKNPNGSGVAISDITLKIELGKPIPSDVDRQEWQWLLTVQLKLWHIAHLPNLPISIKIILLFQIIEILYPPKNNKALYPKYADSSKPPCPYTEAKLLRDWVSHQGQVGSSQLKNYCKYLGIDPPSFIIPRMKSLKGLLP